MSTDKEQVIKKLFALDFYKDQKRWKLSERRERNKSRAITFGNPAFECEHKETHVREPDPEWTFKSEAAVPMEVSDQALLKPGKVAERLNKLTKFAQMKNIKQNLVGYDENNNSDEDDDEVLREQWVGLTTQEYWEYQHKMMENACLNLTFNNSPHQNYDNETFYYDPVSYWFDNHFVSNQSLESLESFLREVHQLPHSTEIDAYEKNDEMISSLVASMTMRELSDNITKHSEALNSLLDECATRTEGHTQNAAYMEARPKEIVLAGSFMDDMNTHTQNAAYNMGARPKERFLAGSFMNDMNTHTQNAAYMEARPKERVLAGSFMNDMNTHTQNAAYMGALPKERFLAGSFMNDMNTHTQNAAYLEARPKEIVLAGSFMNNMNTHTQNAAYMEARPKEIVLAGSFMDDMNTHTQNAAYNMGARPKERFLAGSFKNDNTDILNAAFVYAGPREPVFGKLFYKQYKNGEPSLS